MDFVFDMWQYIPIYQHFFPTSVSFFHTKAKLSEIVTIQIHQILRLRFADRLDLDVALLLYVSCKSSAALATLRSYVHKVAVVVVVNRFPVYFPKGNVLQ